MNHNSVEVELSSHYSKSIFLQIQSFQFNNAFLAKFKYEDCYKHT